MRVVRTRQGVVLRRHARHFVDEVVEEVVTSEEGGEHVQADQVKEGNVAAGLAL